MIDYKQLCAELVEQLDDALDFTVSSETRRHMKLLTRKARAALAEPEPEGPTDEELLDLSVKCDLAYLWGEGEYYSPYMENHNIRDYVLSFARAVEAAVLARWGRPAPQPPADGEVAGLVETLKGIAYWKRHGNPGVAPAPFDIRQADRLDRAANLLEHLSHQFN